MEGIVQLIESLGDLHDATVTEFLWLPAQLRFELEIEDIYWNFEGEPDYAGPVKGRFIFSEVSNFSLDMDLAEIGMVYEWTFQEAGSIGYKCEIRFAPAGKMNIACQAIECRTDNAPR